MGTFHLVVTSALILSNVLWFFCIPQFYWCCRKFAI